MPILKIFLTFVQPQKKFSVYKGESTFLKGDIHMKKTFKSRPLLWILLLVLSLSLLASCAAGSRSDSEAQPSEKNDANGMYGSTITDDKIFEEIGTDSEFERKIVRTVTMSCETKLYDDATTLLMSSLATYNGYVESSDITNENVYDYASKETKKARRAVYVLRVPAENLDAFLEALRIDDGIYILNQDMKSSEITGTYYDTVTRLEALTAEKDALSAMMQNFTDYQDMSAMLEVQERLYDVIEEMEAMQTKLNLYDSQVALSTVNLSLNEVIEFTEVVEEDPTFGERLGAAFVESWTDFGHGCQNFAVWFVEAFPTLLILAVIGTATPIIIVKSVKRRNRRRREQKE